jgi:multiple sugar transport system substrate-binding protein
MAATVRFVYDKRIRIPDASLAAFVEQSGIGVETSPASVDAAGHIDHNRLDGDLLLVDEATVADLLRVGRLAPLGQRAHVAQLDLDDVPQAAIDRFRAADMVYAIPYTASANVLIHRADLLQQYGMTVPITWDELRRAANAVQAALRADGVETVVGFAGRGAAGHDQNFWTVGSSLFPSWGWRWNRGAGEPPLVHESATVDALEVYAAMLRETGPPDAAAVTSADVWRLFDAGNAVFIVEPATAFARVRRDMTGMGVTMVPTGPSGRPEPGLGSCSLCIPATSSAPDDAWDLLHHLVSDERMLVDSLASGNPEPSRASVVAAAEYAAEFSAELQGVVLQTRRYARINRPLIPHAFDLGDIVGAAVEAVIAGEQRADDALRLAQAMIDSMDWQSGHG